jgi:hypothetical protein
MKTRTQTIRHRLIVAAGAGAFELVLAVTASPSRAADGECPAATAPNGPVFGKRFSRLASAAGIAAITGRKATARAAADAAVRDARDTAQENAAAEAAAAACNTARNGEPTRSGTEATSGTAQRSTAAETVYKRPGLMPVSEEIKARKKAFDEFGKVACSSCEGGYSYESWANHFFNANSRDNPNGWNNKLAAMEPGEELHWQGSENYGTIVMRTKERIGGFDCKTYGWVLEKGASSAQRDGLLCWGKASDFSANDSWVEVY